VQVVDPSKVDAERWAQRLFALRQRRGMTLHSARAAVRGAGVLGTLMLEAGEVDGLITGLTRGYGEAIHFPLQFIKTRDGKKAGGAYILAFERELKFLADCTVNAEPTSEELADIAVKTADLAPQLDVTPRVAMPATRPSAAQGREPGPRAPCGGAGPEDAPGPGDRRRDAGGRGAGQRGARVRLPVSRLTGPATCSSSPTWTRPTIAYRLLMRLAGRRSSGRCSWA
jgi:malate dehydrogenase (oxaloacetate-decarboxylating)(NADP+)